MSHTDSMARMLATRRLLEAAASGVADAQAPHNYCFTASDDETCDAGMGDCRALVAHLRGAQDGLRGAIEALRAQEMALAQRALMEAREAVDDES